MSLFLSLDGLDGVGKSTQLAQLADWLRAEGRYVTTCVDPGGTPLGQELRRILLDGDRTISTAAEMLLFMASRAELVATMIRPALGRGDVVLSDRFLTANVVYQGHAGGLDPDEVRRVGLAATAGLLPDLTMILDMPVEAAAARRGRPPDRVESRDAAYHRRVRDGFLAEAAFLGDRAVVIDASPAADVVHRQIREALLTRLGGSAMSRS